MSDDVRFERLLAEVLADAAPARAPDALVPDILAAARRARRRPRWLALAIERPMRLDAQVVVGSPTRAMSRTTFAAAAVVALLALGAALLAVSGGPSPTPSEEPSPSLPAMVAPSSTPSVPSAAPTASPVTDPAGLWIATGTMGSPRGVTNSCRSDGCSSVLLAVRLLDGRVLVVGGSGEWSDPPTAELYDPDSGTWSATGGMLKPQDQGGFLPTLLLDGRVLVRDVDGAELYDPVSGTWSETGKMVTAEWDTATLLLDGKVLVTGLSGAELYDPDSGTWSATGNMITPRLFHTATLLRDGKVLAAGGYDGGDYRVESAELYDPGTGSWTAIAFPQRGCDRPSCPGGGGWATLLQDGTLLRLRDGGGGETYDPATGTWTALAEPDELGSPKALLSDGTVLMAVPGSPESPCTAALYDPRTGSWTTTSSMLRCGNGASFTLLLDGTVLVAGGEVCNESVDAVTGEHRISCGSTGAAVLFVPAGVSPPPLPGFPSPPPPIFPSPTPVPTPFPPAAGPVPPNARSWKVTVDNKSSEPATLFVAEWDLSGVFRLVGSATPNVVPAGATVKVTFLFPADSDPNDGWICVNPGPGEEATLVSAADIGIPGKIVITADGQTTWLSPPGY